LIFEAGQNTGGVLCPHPILLPFPLAEIKTDLIGTDAKNAVCQLPFKLDKAGEVQR
jgi:hypothetical protein